MQQIAFDRPVNREFREPEPHHGYRAAHFGVVTAVAKPFQMIGSCFVGAACWLKDRAPDSFSCFLGTSFDNTLDRIFVLDREKVLRRALLLAEPEMREVKIWKTFKTPIDVPSQKRAERVKNAFLMMTQEMGESDRVDLIEAVASILCNEKDDLIAHTLRGITQKMKISAKVSVLRAVANILPQEREQVVSNVLLLLGSQEVNDCNTVALIKTTAKVPANERKGIAACALRAITRETGGDHRVEIFRAVVNVPARERDQVVTNALLVSEGITDWDDIYELIEAIANIPVHEREGVTVSVLQVITPGMRAVEGVAILRAVAGVSAEERESVLGSALQIMEDQMNAHERIRMIQRMAHASADERPHLVQHFREGGNIFLDARAAAAQGVDVHQGDRDQRVVAAINLLRERQGQISRNRMTRAVQEFTKYLNEREMTSEHKRLAQHALQGPDDPADFGPLINGNDSIPGLGISGKEMIGRLWVFASGLTELDQTMAKEGIISALKDSQDMGRVCQEGKVQRLIVSVLQGRFPGINIELIEGRRVFKEQAVGVFFSVEAHRAIEQLLPLIEAANRFCDQNPLVNRDEFLDEIKAYAEAQFGQKDTEVS